MVAETRLKKQVFPTIHLELLGENRLIHAFPKDMSETKFFSLVKSWKKKTEFKLALRRLKIGFISHFDHCRCIG